MLKLGELGKVSFMIYMLGELGEVNSKLFLVYYEVKLDLY